MTRSIHVWDRGVTKKRYVESMSKYGRILPQERAEGIHPVCVRMSIKLHVFLVDP